MTETKTQAKGVAKVIEGSLVAPKGKKFAIAASRFNEVVVGKLVEGALDALRRHGADMEQVFVVWVPGAFELPLMAKTIAKNGQADAVIALGAVIRGSTDHYDYVCAEVSKGVAQSALETSVPIAFGVLTCDSIEQAVERAGSKAGNKGFDAAVSAIEMVNVLDEIKGI